MGSIDVNLKHPYNEIQETPAAVLSSLMHSYFPVGERGPSDCLQKRVVVKYVQLVNKSSHPAETRGYAIALGSVPKKLLAPSSKALQKGRSCLCNAAKVTSRVGKEWDAETRRKALEALSKTSVKVGFESSTDSPLSTASLEDNIDTVFEAFH